MSFEGFLGSDVRAKLDHPVTDADAHVVECGPRLWVIAYVTLPRTS